MPKKTKKLTRVRGAEMPATPTRHKPLAHKVHFSWIAPQYVQHAKTTRWYLIAGMSALALVLLSLLAMKNWSFALAIVVFSAVYFYLQEYHPPKKVRISISEMGIKVGEVLFPYSHIQAFWIIYTPPLVKTLNLRMHRHFFWDITIQLENEDPVAIRQFLCGQIPEWEGKDEHFTDILLRLLRF